MSSRSSGGSFEKNGNKSRRVVEFLLVWDPEAEFDSPTLSKMVELSLGLLVLIVES